MKKALLFAVLGMAAASQAGAQGLFKCTVDGKVTYQSMPCAKGGAPSITRRRRRPPR